MKESKILIIDICGTLYQSNTTFDMLDYFFYDRKEYKIIKCFRKNRLISFINSLIFRLFKKDIMRHLAIKFLSGYSYADLHKMSQEFLFNFLQSRKNPDVFRIIDSYRLFGSKLISVSATLDCIGEVVAEDNNFELVYASELSYKGNICKGYLKRDLLGNKKQIIDELNIKSFDLITDNYSDSDIIEMSTNVFLVQYKNKKNKWSRVLSENILKKCKYVYV